jgi:hypothetical protein
MKNLSQIAGRPRPKGGGEAVTPASNNLDLRGPRRVLANPAAGYCAHGVLSRTSASAAVSVEYGKEAPK